MTTTTAPRLTKRQCKALAAKAYRAGMIAGNAAAPTPMIVVQRANPFDDNSRITRQYAPVMGGVCGFAYVTVRPGTSTFARYMKAELGGFKAYYGGTQFSVGEFGQSLERKTAFARAYAGVLQEAGVPATIETRMD